MRFCAIFLFKILHNAKKRSKKIRNKLYMLKFKGTRN